MKGNAKKIAKLAAATALGLGVAASATSALAKSTCPVEKCYGIVKKAKNDCGTARHACAGQSIKSGARGEWMFVMKGNCKRIVGGHLNPPSKKAKVEK